MASVPGAQVTAAIVTDQCQTNRGIVGAAEEAAHRLVQAFLACNPENQPGARWHFVLTRERPTSQEASNG